MNLSRWHSLGGNASSRSYKYTAARYFILFYFIFSLQNLPHLEYNALKF